MTTKFGVSKLVALMYGAQRISISWTDWWRDRWTEWLFTIAWSNFVRWALKTFADCRSGIYMLDAFSQSTKDNKTQRSKTTTNSKAMAW